MDDRDQTDTKVVQLRRQAERDEAKRETLARTIFADQDEIGTFSRGNLIPPAASPPRHEDSEPAADSFFDRYQAQGASEQTAANPAPALDGTAAFFDEINARSAADMVASPSPQPAAAAMPGSARLPAQLGQAARGRRKWPPRAVHAPRWAFVAGGRRLHRVSVTVAAHTRTVASGLRLAQPGTRLARSAVLAVLGTVSVAGVALAVAVAISSHSSVPRGAQQASVGSREPTVSPTLAQSLRRSPRTSRRRTTQSHVAKRRAHLRSRRGRGHSTSAGARPSAQPALVVTVVSAPTTTGQAQPSSSSGSQQQTSPPPAAPSTNRATASQSSGSSKQPAFGPTGVLGPGHSPDS